MIKTTNNNFGAPEITIKDYQCEKYVVLNSKFTFDRNNADYQSAEVLEINVPALSIPKSGISAAYVMAKVEDDLYYGTTVKTWIKNANTICIEKIDKWENAMEYSIYLLSMYVTKGQRKSFTVGTNTSISFSLDNSSNKPHDEICYIDDNWCLLHFTFDSYSAPKNDLPEIIRIEGFPTDVTAELPFVSCRYDNYTPIAGAKMKPGTLEAGVITVSGYMFDWGGMPVSHFFYGVFVRDTTEQ